MKICVISYDYFGYDKHILLELQKQGIEGTHVDISKHEFSYKNKFQKVQNFFFKLLFSRNMKQNALKKNIFDQLNKIGFQDKILVVRPDLISRETHLAIKKQSSEYICYLYDSCNRFNINHLSKGVFDRIYSYDLQDAKKYGFIHITNFMYFPKVEIPKTFKYDLFIAISADERLHILNKLMTQFGDLNLFTKCIVVSKLKPAHIHANIEFKFTNAPKSEINAIMKDSKVFLDLIRKNHSGLSFRIFEAMALQRKIITTNESIKTYDFYNPKNILVIDDDNLLVDKKFFETVYEPIKSKTFYHYTIENWVSNVFFPEI